MKPVTYIPDFANRFVPCFYEPEDYGETLDESYDSKCIVMKMFLESLKKLSYEELLSLQSLLILTSCWNEEYATGTYTEACDYTSPAPYPVTVSLLSRFLEMSKPKLTKLLKRVFIKMPELKNLFKPHVIESIMRNNINPGDIPDYKDTDTILDIFKNIGIKLKESNDEHK